MVYEKVRRFIEQRFSLVGSLIVLVAVVALLVSEFIPEARTILVTGGIFNVAVIVLLVDVLNRLIEMKTFPNSPYISRNQDEACSSFESYMRNRPLHSADLLEYSTSTITTFLERLRDANCNIRLLMCH